MRGESSTGSDAWSLWEAGLKGLCSGRWGHGESSGGDAEFRCIVCSESMGKDLHVVSQWAEIYT